jgi:hypothetical protein
MAPVQQKELHISFLDQQPHIRICGRYNIIFPVSSSSSCNIDPAISALRTGSAPFCKSSHILHEQCEYFPRAKTSFKSCSHTLSMRRVKQSASSAPPQPLTRIMTTISPNHISHQTFFPLKWFAYSSLRTLLASIMEMRMQSA